MANKSTKLESMLMPRVEYNPDVLNCIANLSSDEVFTPPILANQMLDLLPQELFQSTETTFLDPFTKSGVFLREIVKRLVEAQLPGYQQRVSEIEEKETTTEEDKAYMAKLHQVVDHILKKQVFGIASTELTSYLSRRSLYCSKDAAGEHSVAHFSTHEGNVLYTALKHTWIGGIVRDHKRVHGKCKYCGASQDVYDRGDAAEQYAYQFIHTEHPETIFNNMKFDVIIGNPPYQLNDGGGTGSSAMPLYHKFVEQAMKLNPRYLSMIIPARWYAGGKGLDDFRDTMLNSSHFRTIVDYANSADCFPGVIIAGGVCYFLWERDYCGACSIINMQQNNVVSKETRSLNEYSTFVRDNTAIKIIRKVLSSKPRTLASTVHSRNCFSVISSVTGHDYKKNGDAVLLSLNGRSFISPSEFRDTDAILNKYKVIMTKAMSGGNKPSLDGNYQVVSSLSILNKNEICTETYLCLDAFNTRKEAEGLESYVKTKFFRFLLLQALTSINISKDKFAFVPVVNYLENWTDEKLYNKFNLNPNEVAFIESMIKPLGEEE